MYRPRIRLLYQIKRGESSIAGPDYYLIATRDTALAQNGGRKALIVPLTSGELEPKTSAISGALFKFPRMKHFSQWRLNVFGKVKVQNQATFPSKINP